ncbi:MAG: NUDIX hydrolase [Salinivirgaceae bacterium]|nr:NUDIX hydrolase [Salinivirgaceae bacterium]
MVFESYINQEKHLVSIDCAIFGYHEGELKLLLFQREKEPEKGNWSLIGGWVNADESAEDAATRVLQHITGLHDIYLQQVSTFSKPERDPGGRVISIVFYALVFINEERMKLSSEFGARWWPVKSLPTLIFDHGQMFEAAFEKLRTDANHNLVGRGLLPEKFTILQLRNIYNSIFFKDFDPGNFRRKVMAFDALEKLTEKDTKVSRKGAYYYKFKD